jgi:hypothetical protein
MVIDQKEMSYRCPSGIRTLERTNLVLKDIENSELEKSIQSRDSNCSRTDEPSSNMKTFPSLPCFVVVVVLGLLRERFLQLFKSLRKKGKEF